MKQNFRKKTLGLLGGGQLARMLILKGHEMGLPIKVLSPSSEDPAAQVTSHWIQGDPNSKSDLKKFLAQVDLATFESEFIDSALLTTLSNSQGTPIKPSPYWMGRLQDRWPQKQALVKYGFKTSPFVKVDTIQQAEKIWDKLSTKPSFKGLVFKQRRFGYDGYGTFIAHSKKSLQNFQKILLSTSDGFIAEEFVPFHRELALTVARNRRGELATLPLVESCQVNSKCDWVKGPCHHKKAKNLIQKVHLFLEKIKYEGIITFELFDTQKDLLVNEIAPRVHNSAHYSLEALSQDQFSLHLKAILNLPLENPTLLKPGFAMANLIGHTTQPPKWSLPPQIRLHWYGKRDNRKGRKMGHITSLDLSPDKALKSALAARKEFQL